MVKPSRSTTEYQAVIRTCGGTRREREGKRDEIAAIKLSSRPRKRRKEKEWRVKVLGERKKRKVKREKERKRERKKERKKEREREREREKERKKESGDNRTYIRLASLPSF